MVWLSEHSPASSQTWCRSLNFLIHPCSRRSLSPLHIRSSSICPSFPALSCGLVLLASLVCLEKEELTEIFSSWAQAYGKANPSNPTELIDEILNKMDVNKDGRLDLREFIELFEEVMMKNSPLTHSQSHSSVRVQAKMW
jgi:hypothetical protein